jgi:hypothetical protein
MRSSPRGKESQNNCLRLAHERKPETELQTISNDCQGLTAESLKIQLFRDLQVGL